jgi:hypothetical protein
MPKRKRVEESLWNSALNEIPNAFQETMSNLRYIFDEGKPEIFPCFNRTAEGYRKGNDIYQMEILKDGEVYLISLDYEGDVMLYILSQSGILETIEDNQDRTTLVLRLIQQNASELMKQVADDIDKRDEHKRYIKFGVACTAAASLLWGSIALIDNHYDGAEERRRESYDLTNSSLPASTYTDGMITTGFISSDELDDIPEHKTGESLIHPRRYEISREDIVSNVCGVVDVGSDDASKLRIVTDGSALEAGAKGLIAKISDEQIQVCFSDVREWTWEGKTSIAVQIKE